MCPTWWTSVDRYQKCQLSLEENKYNIKFWLKTKSKIPSMNIFHSLETDRLNGLVDETFAIVTVWEYNYKLYTEWINSQL